MSPIEDTLLQISRILSFNTDNFSLKHDIHNQSINWDNVVK